RHTRFSRDWSSDVCSSDLEILQSAHPTIPALCWTLLLGKFGMLFDQLARHRDGGVPFLVYFQPTSIVEQLSHRLVHSGKKLGARSEERRVGKSVGVGGWRV